METKNDRLEWGKNEIIKQLKQEFPESLKKYPIEKQKKLKVLFKELEQDIKNCQSTTKLYMIANTYKKKANQIEKE